MAGGAVGAALGAAVGMLAGGPAGAASLALFFAAGGSLAGLISGASQESAPEAGELRLEDDHTASRSNDPQLAALSDHLRNQALLDAVGLHSFRFVPLVRTDEAA
jgi:hypothetical protein